MATEFEFPDDGMDPQVFMDEFGREIPNPNPIVIHLPSGLVNDFDRVRELIRYQLSAEAAAREEETFEDANDFDVPGDVFPVSPHEYDEDTEAADREALAVEAEREARAKAGKAREGEEPSSSKPRRRKADSQVDEDGVQPAQPPAGDDPAS